MSWMILQDEIPYKPSRASCSDTVNVNKGLELDHRHNSKKRQMCGDSTVKTPRILEERSSQQGCNHYNKIQTTILVLCDCNWLVHFLTKVVVVFATKNIFDYCLLTIGILTSLEWVVELKWNWSNCKAKLFEVKVSQWLKLALTRCFSWWSERWGKNERKSETLQLLSRWQWLYIRWWWRWVFRAEREHEN